MLFFFNFKTTYEVPTPISLKTNNKTPNYVIEHLHICVQALGLYWFEQHPRL